MAGKFKFPQQLLDQIAVGRNSEVIEMLDEELIKASDDYGSLLHYAVTFDNQKIISHLIKAGHDIDFMSINGTPLFLAVQQYRVAIVKILLEAGANIHIIGNSIGESALQMIFNRHNLKCEIIEAFIDRLRTETKTSEELVEKLIGLGSSLYHAVCSRDVEVVNCMLNRGFDVNSRGPHQMTALHASVQLGEMNLTKWLLDRGADIEAIDRFDRVPLELAASRGNRVMLQFLLEHGANPNVKNGKWQAPLCSIFRSSYNGLVDNQYDECAECLLQYGAIPCNPIGFPFITLFDSAISGSNDNRCRMLTAHLAMLKMLGTSITESVMHCKREENHLKMLEYEKYHQQCQQILTVIIFGKWSLLDLLNTSEKRMMLLVRNNTFVSEIDQVCSQLELNKLYPYYHNTLMKRISKAKRMVALENASIPVVVQLLKGNFNHYFIAREIVSYLNEGDLRRVCE